MNHKILKLLTELTTYKVEVSKEAIHDTQTLEFYGKGAPIETILFNGFKTSNKYAKHLDSLFESIKSEINLPTDGQSSAELYEVLSKIVDKLRHSISLISTDNYSTIGNNKRLSHPTIMFIWKSGELELQPTQEIESYNRDGEWNNSKIKALIKPFLDYNIDYLDYCIRFFENWEDYQYKSSPLNSNQRQTINLPENFSLRKENLKIDSMTLSQSVILFHYLKEFKLILEYNNSSLAKFIHYLTGHSEHNIRTEKGLGRIFDLINDSKKGVDFYDLRQVKHQLEKVIKNIDDTIGS